jgi:GNAT superfamily N-acetyltransferase
VAFALAHRRPRQPKLLPVRGHRTVAIRGCQEEQGSAVEAFALSESLHRITSGLMVTAVEPRHEAELSDLFAAIDTTFFRPHRMNAAGAAEIARYAGHDVYLIGHEQGVAVAYGMLRGWDEGYDVPSLGVAVRTDHQGHGDGRAMMLALHQVALWHGSDQVRLRVAPANKRARGLYESLGYVDIGTERGERLMVTRLRP